MRLAFFCTVRTSAYIAHMQAFLDKHNLYESFIDHVQNVAYDGETSVRSKRREPGVRAGLLQACMDIVRLEWYLTAFFSHDPF